MSWRADILDYSAFFEDCKLVKEEQTNTLEYWHKKCKEESKMRELEFRNYRALLNVEQHLKNNPFSEVLLRKYGRIEEVDYLNEMEKQAAAQNIYLDNPLNFEFEQVNTGCLDINTGAPIYTYRLKDKRTNITMRPGQLCYFVGSVTRGSGMKDKGAFSCALIQPSGQGKWLVEIIKERGNLTRSFNRRHDVPVGYQSVGKDKYAYISTAVLRQSDMPFYFMMSFPHHTIKGKREILQRLETQGYHFPSSNLLCHTLYSDMTLDEMVGIYADGFNLRPIMASDGSKKKPARYSRIEPFVASNWGAKLTLKSKGVGGTFEHDSSIEELVDTYFDDLSGEPLLGFVDPDTEEEFISQLPIEEY